MTSEQLPADKAPPAKPIRNPASLLILFPLIAVPIAIVVVMYVRTRTPPLPVLRDAPSFQLQDHTGKGFASDSLRGKAWIANFVFTRCEIVCPISTAKMADVQRRLGPATKVRLVSFSVDPQYDTPERLRAYAARFKANLTNWSFLRGKRREMKDIVSGGFKIAMGIIGIKDDAETDTSTIKQADMVHGEHFVLVDGQQRVRGYYKLEGDASLQTLVEHAERLAKN